MGVGAIEPQFYAELMRLLGFGDEDLSNQNDRTMWPAMKERFVAIFATRTRAEWEEIFAGSDACVAPVLSAGEAPEHPHNKARGTFTEVAGVVQPARRPGSSRPRAPSGGPRPTPARTATRPWSTGACPPTRCRPARRRGHHLTGCRPPP